MGQVHEVNVDADKCIRHECCVDICPEVFEIDEDLGIARVKADADAFFETHALQIVEAVRACPVGAIWASADKGIT